ncbi:DNA recombination protein RmuC [Alphaproteobacteria bacterium]|nr:DNA recombination protein RmuC [Alphaproteobacteria bacterium]
MDSLELIYLIVLTALIGATYFINQQRLLLKKEREENNSEIDRLKSRLVSLEAEKASNDRVNLEKINSFQQTISDKDKVLEAFAKDKNEQIENLKKDRQSVVEDIKDYLGKDFENTSNNVFDNANKKLFSQFEKYFRDKNELAQKDIEGIVNPINDTLDKLKKANKEFTSIYERDFSSISSLIDQAQKTMDLNILETAKLSTALKGSSKFAGRWGEIQLDKILEMSQMSEYTDFKTQDVLEDNSRPDAVVYLPGDRQIVIDAKASVKDFVESMETDDPASQKILLASHAQNIRAHMQRLSKKKYWDSLDGSVDMVVMFVPGDNFLHAALQEDPEIFHDALKSKVLVVGPQNLFVTLKTMSLMWSKDKQSREAGRIIEIGKELLRRVQNMTGHLSSLGENIRKTGKSYNSFIGSMDRKFFPKASELSEFYPELEEKKSSKPQLVEDTIKESSKILDLKIHNNDDLSSQ